MATAPVFVAEYETAAWDSPTSPRAMMSAAAVNAGDFIVCCGVSESNGPGEQQLSFTENGAASLVAGGALFASNTSEIRIDSYTVPSNETLTLNVACSSGFVWFGGNALRFSGSSGMGAVASANDTSGDNTISITTTQDNSAVVVVTGDWTSQSQTGLTFATVNGYAPTIANGGVKTNYRDSGGSHYAVNIAVYPDVGAAGAKTVGLTAPDSTNCNIIAFEVKGPAATFDTKARLPATNTVTTANPAVVSMTLGAKAKALYLGIVVVGTTARTGGAPTYNGIAMTQIGVKTNSGGTPEVNAEHWYLLDPPVGAAYNISVPNSGALAMTLQAASVNATPGFNLALDAHAETPGNSTNPSATIACNEAGGIWFSTIGNGAQTWAPTGRSGTQLYDWDAAAWGCGSQYKQELVTGTKTSSWVFGTSEDWVQMLASFKVVAAGIAGDLLATEANDVLAATGAKTFHGSAGPTEVSDTSAFSGSVIPKFHTGSVAAIEGVDVFAATGDTFFPSMSGYLETIEARDALAATGAKTFHGGAGLTEAADAGAFSGSVIPKFHAGSMSALEALDALAASGSVFAPGAISGYLSALEALDVLAATGAKTFYGGLAVTEALDALAASGSVIPSFIAGSFALSEGTDVAEMAGEAYNPGTIFGSAALVEAPDSTAFSGSKTFSGAFAAVEPLDVAAGQGNVIVSFITGTLATAEAPDVFYASDMMEMDMGIGTRDSNIGIGISPNEPWRDGQPSWGRDGSDPKVSFPGVIGGGPQGDNFSNNQTSRRAKLLQAHIFVPAGQDIEPGWYTNHDVQPNEWAWCVHRTWIQNDSDNPLGQPNLVGQIETGADIREAQDKPAFVGTVTHPE